MSELPGDVDVEALEAVLEAELDVDVTDVSVLADGLNLLLSVSTVAAPDAYVTRSPRKLRDASYMTDLRSEYAVMDALADTAVPTPDPVLFCADESVLGEPFFAMTRLDGEVVDLGSDLPQRFRTPGAREAFAESLVDVLAEIHRVPLERSEGVCEHHSPREQVERSSARLEAAMAVTGHDVPALRRVGDWLLEHAPADCETTLVHGDYRPGNVLFAGTETPEITGVLDWETAMLGDPLTELGYLLLRWRDADDPTPSLDGIEARHPEQPDALERLRSVNEHGFAPYTARAGSPTRRALVERYERATGLSFADERFYVALAAYGLGTVWADLHRHALEAGERSEWAPHVEHVALVAASIVDGEFEI